MSSSRSNEVAEQTGLPAGAELYLPSNPQPNGRTSPAGVVRLREQIRAVSARLGFCATGFTSVERLDQDSSRLVSWLARGFHADMTYLGGNGDRAAPGSLLPEARAMIVVALPYRAEPVLDSEPGPHPVAGFARGRDYHGVTKRKLAELARAVADLSHLAVRARACVDTAPLLERAAARRAGVGFIGRNTLLGSGFYQTRLFMEIRSILSR